MIEWRTDTENAHKDGRAVLLFELGGINPVVGFWGSLVGGKCNPISESTWCVTGSGRETEIGIVFNPACQFDDDDLLAWAEINLPCGAMEDPEEE